MAPNGTMYARCPVCGHEVTSPGGARIVCPECGGVCSRGEAMTAGGPARAPGVEDFAWTAGPAFLNAAALMWAAVASPFNGVGGVLALTMVLVVPLVELLAIGLIAGNVRIDGKRPARVRWRALVGWSVVLNGVAFGIALPAVLMLESAWGAM